MAAYFAFIEEDSADQTDRRIVYALNENEIVERSAVILARHKSASRPSIIEFVRPQLDENARLISQERMFTRSPAADDIESWIARNFPRSHKTNVLIKFAIPNSDRIQCLLALNTMNINHLSLFPDLEGASRYCNLACAIAHY